MFGIRNVITPNNYDLNQGGINLEEFRGATYLRKLFPWNWLSSWMINAMCIRQILSLSKVIPITLARLSLIHSADGAISQALVAASSLA